MDKKIRILYELQKEGAKSQRKIAAHTEISVGLVNRLLKELLANVYKHSDGNQAWITLIQENSMIELHISDNGSAHADSLISADKGKHKGIASAAEQVNYMEGTMQIQTRPAGDLHTH